MEVDLRVTRYLERGYMASLVVSKAEREERLNYRR